MTPHKAEDSRYIHRGAMNWDLADLANNQIFLKVNQLEQIRKKEKAFVSNADTRTWDTGEKELLCIERCCEGEQIIGIFSFSEHDKKVWIDGLAGDDTDLLTGQKKTILGIDISEYGFHYLKKKK